MMLSTMLSTNVVDWSELFKELEQDVFLSCLKKDVEGGGNGEILHFSVAGGRLMYKNRVVIPKHSIFVTKLLQEYHDSLVGGHSGELKTYLRIGEKMWPNMFKNAASARETKGSNQSPAGLLQPIPLPAQLWDQITMDFIEGLPRSQGFDTVLVVVDHLTKYAHFIKLKHPFTALTVATVFIVEVVRLHGFPISIISDRDRIFMSLFW